MSRLGIAEQIHPGLIWSDTIEAECVRFRIGIPGGEPLFYPGGIETGIVDEEGPVWIWFSSLPRETITELGNRLGLSDSTAEEIENTKLMREEFPAFKERKTSEAVFFLDNIPLSSMYCYSRFCISDREHDLMLEYLKKWSLFEPVTTGRDLGQMGFKPGQETEQVLKRLRAAWIDGEIRTAEEERELLGRIRQKGLRDYGG